MRHSAGSNCTVEYHCEFETEFENILGCFFLVPRDNRWTKKTEGRKSRDTVPLNRPEV
jgi:hypothetical protein